MRRTQSLSHIRINDITAHETLQKNASSGLDYVQMAIQRLIGFGKKEELKEILAILRKQKPDRIRVL